MFSTFDNPWLQRLILMTQQEEERNKLLQPLHQAMEAYPESIKNINSIIDSCRSFSQTPYFVNYLINSGVSSDYFSLYETIRKSLGGVHSISMGLQEIRQVNGFESILANQEALYSLQEQVPKISDSNQFALNRIESVLAAAEAKSRLSEPNHLFLNYTLQGISGYQSFLKKQYKRLELDQDAVAKRRLKIIDLTGCLFELVNTSLSIGANLEEDEPRIEAVLDKDETAHQDNLYSQVNQHLSFVYRENYEGEVEEDFGQSSPAKLCKTGSFIVEIIHNINLVNERQGKDSIFKPTTKNMRACGLLPTLVANNENDFGNLIDHLYFLLYEGSGSATRLTDLVDESVLEPLWRIKHLRTSMRHDIDHGADNKIKKNREKISSVYQHLIEKPLPIVRGDWIRIQLKIYEETSSMLTTILQTLIEA